MTLCVRVPYTRDMLIDVPDVKLTPRTLAVLKKQRDTAFDNFNRHVNPGGLRPSDLRAFELQETALRLLLIATQVRLDSEQLMRGLLKSEGRATDD